MERKPNTLTTVKIKCKPVVKAYLENNFGKPVTFPDGHVLGKLAFSQLGKENPRFNQFEDYTECINLSIGFNNFRYDGFSITNENTRIFNVAIDNYIKNITRTNLDALLISQEKQMDWKAKFLDLVNTVNNSKGIDADAASTIRKMKKELEQHEVNIKKAIEIVVTKFLKIEMDLLNYEAVKKDYYRYRKNLFLPQLSPDIN